MPLNKDDVIECEIESLALGGRGVAHVDGMAVFVAGGLPGDTVEARIVRAKKRFAEAEVVSVKVPSPDRVEPLCPHFGTCGGCAVQDLDYRTQLFQKAEQVEGVLQRIGGVEDPGMIAPLASPDVWRYRNKMEFAFEQREDGLHLGLRERSKGGRQLPPVIDIEDCYLCAERDVEILQKVRAYCVKAGVKAYDPATGEGFWRHLVIRHTMSGEVMVHVITTPESDHFPKVEILGEALVSRFRTLASFVHSSRGRRSTLAVGEKVEFRLGHKFIEERLPSGDHEVHYYVSPNAFFQTNSAAAAGLFDTVAQLGEFDGTETVLDLYCGIGAISIFLADKVARVIGIELSEEAVGKAWGSAKLNNLTNCEFHAANLDGEFAELKRLPRPDVIVVDPPRSGMSPKTVEIIRKFGPKKLIAVSCDPATLARDVKQLSDEYVLRRARAVDMFPHTHHIETVALLERRES